MIGLRKFLLSFFYASKGIFFVFRNERNMKVHLLAIIVVSTAGCYFHISEKEWIAVILCFALVMGFEMLNTAIELLANKISPEHDKEIGRVKDIAAGAVLAAALFSIVIACLIFTKYLWHYI